MTISAARSTDGTLDCDLCLVGAGYAALNGLNAAAKYLAKGARVVVIDKNQSWGGQWLHQYDFVRLHQPYRMFTAGDQPWTLARDPSYLATRREVLDHLQTVPPISGAQLELKPLFGHAYRGHAVRDGRVEVEALPVENGERPTPPVRIRARRLLKATGAEIEVLRPLPLSSQRVRSVAVSDRTLTTREFLESKAPIYIVGSGKTAMDTARHFALQGRRVNILIGSGMWFFSRDNLYPRGPRRYLGGALTVDCFLRICELFDGENEQHVMSTLAREGILFNVFGQAGNCRFGLLSLSERDEILANVEQIFHGHLVDVDGTRMVVREGAEERSVPVAEGSWFINCTTHFRHLAHEPVLQDGGLVCAPQAALGFTGTTAYYLTHLWFLDALGALAPQLFRTRVDLEPKLRWAPQLALAATTNLTRVMASLPLAVPRDFLGDFNKWYPLHRQLWATARVVAKRAAIHRKAERILQLRFEDAPDPN